LKSRSDPAGYPLITVYIATKDRCSLLERAVSSVFSQTYPNIELIISDDGSRDNTEQYCRDLEVKNNNVVYVRTEVSKGACYARNRAIEVARGTFITGLDDDDEFTPHRVMSLFRLFNPNEYSCIASSVLERNASGYAYRASYEGVVDLTLLLHSNVLGNQVMTLTNRLVKINGFDETFPSFQDYDTWVRLVEAYGLAQKVAERSYIWHTGHDSEQITRVKEKKIEGLAIFVHKHKAKMSAAHMQSMELLEKKFQNNALSFTEMTRLINTMNYKEAISLFLNSNYPSLKSIIDKIRFWISNLLDKTK